MKNNDPRHQFIFGIGNGSYPFSTYLLGAIKNKYLFCIGHVKVLILFLHLNYFREIDTYNKAVDWLFFFLFFFSKGANLWDLLFAKPPIKRAVLYKERICSSVLRSKFFLFREEPYQQWAQKHFYDWVASLASWSIAHKQIFELWWVIDTSQVYVSEIFALCLRQSHCQ